jgi:hypothetical protein
VQADEEARGNLHGPLVSGALDASDGEWLVGLVCPESARFGDAQLGGACGHHDRAVLERSDPREDA